MKTSVTLIVIIVLVMITDSIMLFAYEDVSLAGTTWRTGRGLRAADLIFTDRTFTGKVLWGKFSEGTYLLSSDGMSVICTFTWVKDGDPPVGSKSIMRFVDENTLEDDDGRIWIRR
jgi:hypothetical protein